jgi:hypothetical protein
MTNPESSRHHLAWLVKHRQTAVVDRVRHFALRRAFEWSSGSIEAINRNELDLNKPAHVVATKPWADQTPDHGP